MDRNDFLKKMMAGAVLPSMLAGCSADSGTDGSLLDASDETVAEEINAAKAAATDNIVEVSTSPESSSGMMLKRFSVEYYKTKYNQLALFNREKLIISLLGDATLIMDPMNDDFTVFAGICVHNDYRDYLDYNRYYLYVVKGSFLVEYG